MTVVYRDQFKVRADGLYIGKRANEEADYPIDYGPWLAKQGPGGDQIDSSVWEYEDGISLEGAVENDTVAVAWISGGERGMRYRVVNRIVTVGGREIEQPFYLEIDRRL